MLYVAGVPLVIVLAVVLFVGVVASNRGSTSSSAALTPPAHLTPQAAAALARERTQERVRQTYSDCLKSMGVNFGGFRTRFSRGPSRDTLRTASGVCRTVLRDGSFDKSPKPQQAAAPNVL
jgi:hypothetical protein